MNNLKSPFALLFITLAIVCFQTSAWGQSDTDFAKVSSSGTSVRWDVGATNAGVTLTISAPDGQVFRKDVKNGSSVEFKLIDSRGEKLPDGNYAYELRLTPVLSADIKETLAAARIKGNDDDVARDLRRRGVLPPSRVQSGAFSILNGAAIVAGSLQEDGRSAGKVTEPAKMMEQHRVSSITTGARLSRLLQHHARLNPMPDFVIADDLIVQGSACVGLDCVDGEVFGFDTIRMKENNTRLQYDDTSVSAGFATNNWQLRANSSASGGASFLGIVDQGSTGNSESGTIIAQFDAGAPANSLRVSSTGNLGVGTATPVLDVHANTSDTPAIRLEQNNSGGFTAQTWDIGANEANFFVRDVTSGSRLSFRIRPGAPTSSIDISADGDVGVGTASPAAQLHVLEADNNSFAAQLEQTNATASNGLFIKTQTTNAGDNALHVTSNNGATVILSARNNGRVGINTTTPDQLLSVNGDASKAGGGLWQTFSDERLKTLKGPFNTGLKAVMQLQPVRYEYKPDNALGIKSEGEHVGFGAQSLQRIIPEAVSATDNGYLMVNGDPIIWTMLNAIKEQQKEIEQLKTEVRRLRATSRRRR